MDRRLKNLIDRIFNKFINDFSTSIDDVMDNINELLIILTNLLKGIGIQIDLRDVILEILAGRNFSERYYTTDGFTRQDIHYFFGTVYRHSVDQDLQKALHSDIFKDLQFSISSIVLSNRKLVVLRRRKIHDSTLHIFNLSNKYENNELPASDHELLDETIRLNRLLHDIAESGYLINNKPKIFIGGSSLAIGIAVTLSKKKIFRTNRN